MRVNKFLSFILSKRTISFFICLVFVYLIFQKLDIKKVCDAFGEFNFKYLFLIVPVYYSSFVFRTMRWKELLSGGSGFRLKNLVSGLFIGYMANALLPARMGDFYRSHLLGKSEGVSRLNVLTSVVLERIFDGSVLFVILLLLVLNLHPSKLLFGVIFSAGIIFIGGFATLLLFAKLEKNGKVTKLVSGIKNHLPDFLKKQIQKIEEKIKYHFESFIDGLDVFHSCERLVKSLFLTLVIWGLEGTVMFLVISSFGIKISILSVAFVLCVTVFSTMIPAGPGGLGPYQYGYILALSFFNVTKEIAFAASIVNQFTVMGLLLIAGLFCMWKQPINLEADLEVVDSN